ncbi:MAG: DUF4968 domain-containing protein, partial [Chitinispirillaceae bacterium]|nr:DUF4968 domain-containing protein [Chitinispirillaceae bacterium]
MPYRTIPKFRLPQPVIASMAVVLLLVPFQSSGQTGDYSSHAESGRSVVIMGSSGTIRITPYGDYMVRIQAKRSNEEFYPDDRYEMVERHDWEGKLTVQDDASSLTISTAAADGITVSIAKSPL